MIFLICGPSEFYLDCGFSKVPGDVLIIVVQLTPVGFIQPVVFQKCVVIFFIRGGVLKFVPLWL